MESGMEFKKHGSTYMVRRKTNEVYITVGLSDGELCVETKGDLTYHMIEDSIIALRYLAEKLGVEI